MANSLLLILLLRVYVQNYSEMKTVFGMGLVVFAAFMLLENLLALYFHLAMVEYYSSQVMEHAFFLSAAQTVALLVLSWVTYKE